MNLLVSSPDRTLSFWKQNFESYIQELDTEIEVLGQLLKEGNLLKKTHERISMLRPAKIENKKLLRNFMSFMGDPLPDLLLSDQGEGAGLEFKRYLNQAFRDWVWVGSENAKQLQCLLKFKPFSPVKKLLVLGSGACRLGFDFSQQRSTVEEVYFLDLNPFLLKIGSSMIMGDSAFSFIDFPNYPVGHRDLSTLYLFDPKMIPKKRKDIRYEFVWADATQLPFELESFDAILTSWFLDIYPKGMAALMNQVAKYLKKGGEWYNTGSVATANLNLKMRWTYEEVLECLAVDFQEIQSRHDEIPYLENSGSYQKRNETVFSFCAQRKESIQNIRDSVLETDWPLDRPVALSARAVSVKQKYEIVSFVLSQIDNQASLADIALSVSQKYGLNEKESVLTVSRFFKRLL